MSTFINYDCDYCFFALDWRNVMNSAEEKFIQIFGNDLAVELCEEICECLWNNENTERIYVAENNKIDVINSYGLCYISHKNKEYELEFRNGNNDGFVIVQFDENIDYQPPKQQKRIFILDENKCKLRNINIKKAKAIFNSKKEDHQEMARKMSYDLYFSPTNNIRKYYNDYMNKWCLSVEWIDF